MQDVPQDSAQAAKKLEKETGELVQAGPRGSENHATAQPSKVDAVGEGAGARQEGTEAARRLIFHLCWACAARAVATSSTGGAGPAMA